jgi:hypothetical protein
MTRTKRFYNKPNRVKDFFHPWIQFCCGNCRSCKDRMKSKRRRLEYKWDTRKLIRMEKKLLKDFPDHKELEMSIKNHPRGLDDL